MTRKRRRSIGSLDEVVGRNVLEARKDRKLSQTAFGGPDGVGVYLGHVWPKQVVSKIERGLRPLDAPELVAVAMTLGVSVSDLLTAPEEDLEIEVVISPEYNATVGELRDAVMGDRAEQYAAAVAEARRTLIAGIERGASISSRGRVSAKVEVVRKDRSRR